MISCKEASELSIKKIAGNISLRQQFQLFLHNRACAICKRFETQVAWLINAAKNLSSQESFTAQEKNTLKDRLDQFQRTAD